MKKDFVEALTAIAESVYDFHVRWDLLNSFKSPHDTICDRENLLLEEIKELAAEYNKSNKEKSVELLSREAADVLYVSVGSMLVLGDEGIKAMLQVSKKNNNKTRESHFFDEEVNKVKRLDV